MVTHLEPDDERRRRRRALIRAHHPDRGGDPDEFIRLLDRLKEDRPLSERHPEMRFAQRRRWWQASASFRPFRRARRPKRVV